MKVPIDAKLTIAALAWREGEHLRKCFTSLQPVRGRAGAHTVIVLDSTADARTAEIAHRVADIVSTHPFQNFSSQRNYALDAVSTEWVFFIDPDERMTPALAQEILQVIGRGADAAYRVPRRNILFGKEVRHTGWSPDYQVRLLRVESCRYNETQEVHEVPIVNGSVGTLEHPLIHFNYATWRQFIAKQRSYAPLEARALYAAGHRAHLYSFVGQPLREFKRRYIEYKGYKDGLLGLALSLAMSAYRLLTTWHLSRLQSQKPR